MIISKNNLKFWSKNSKLLKWYKKPEKTFERRNDKSFRWYLGGKLNIYYNLILQHKLKNPYKIAISTVSKDYSITHYTYKKIDELVNIFLNNLLTKNNIKKVMIHSSASIDSSVSMLACAKSGIFFSVIF